MKYPRNFPRFLLALSLIGLSVATSLLAQDESGGGLRQMMSPEQFKASGLEKLTPDELENLNAWLRGDREKTAKQAATKATRAKINLVVSRIDGFFPGLTGTTIIKLQDGTVWKQASRSDRHKGPGGENLAAVVIKAGLFGYRMRIEGTPEFYVDEISGK